MAASQLLADVNDFRRLGISAGRLEEEGVDVDDLLPYLHSASSVAIGILTKRYKFPLASWCDDLRTYVVQLATHRFWQSVGYKVLEGQKDTIREDFKDATAALKEVANGTRDLDGVVDATPEVEEGGSVVASDPLLVETGSAYDLLAGVVIP